MKFCKVCDNMLYIEVTEEQNLKYYCKNCNFNEIHQVEAESTVISEKTYTNDLANLSSYINPNIKYDLTLPRVSNIACPECKPTDNEVIYIKYDQRNMKYLYFCCKCEHFWRNEM